MMKDELGKLPTERKVIVECGELECYEYYRVHVGRSADHPIVEGTMFVASSKSDTLSPYSTIHCKGGHLSVGEAYFVRVIEMVTLKEFVDGPRPKLPDVFTITLMSYGEVASHCSYFSTEEEATATCVEDAKDILSTNPLLTYKFVESAPDCDPNLRYGEHHLVDDKGDTIAYLYVEKLTPYAKEE